jgi:hypothetical protein
MSSLMAVTDRIFISTQQDIQLLDFILKQKSSEAIIAYFIWFCSDKKFFQIIKNVLNL